MIPLPGCFKILTPESDGTFCWLCLTINVWNDRLLCNKERERMNTGAGMHFYFLPSSMLILGRPSGISPSICNVISGVRWTSPYHNISSCLKGSIVFIQMKCDGIAHSLTIWRFGYKWFARIARTTRSSWVYCNHSELVFVAFFQVFQGDCDSITWCLASLGPAGAEAVFALNDVLSDICTTIVGWSWPFKMDRGLSNVRWNRSARCSRNIWII